MKFVSGSHLENQQQGMTLVELLIAITLSVVIAGYSYSLFQSILISKERITGSQQSLADLRLFYQLIEKDLVQFHPAASERDNFGQVEAALLGSLSNELTLTRVGWKQSPTQLELRSHLQRVNWTQVEQNSQTCRHTQVEGMSDDSWYCIARSHNRQMDSLYDDDVVSVDIAGYIRNFKIEYLYEDDQQTINRATEWPLLNAPQAVLRALDITFEHQHFGTLNWLFEVPQI